MRGGRTEEAEQMNGGKAREHKERMKKKKKNNAKKGDEILKSNGLEVSRITCSECTLTFDPDIHSSHYGEHQQEQYEHETLQVIGSDPLDPKQDGPQ